MTRTPRQNDYVQRVHRVMDHIERNLAEPLHLEDLARVACFSPFHFHRIFTAVTGETLSRFVRRLRLERAASRLLTLQAQPVTEIAYGCGFSSPAAFSRAFKAHFGMSATEWRTTGGPPVSENRKDGKAVRKEGEEGRSRGAYDGGAADETWPHRRTPMTTPSLEAESIRVEDVPTREVAYVRHTGPYAGDGELFGRLIGQLMQWAGPRGLATPDAQLMSVYHDDPQVTDEDKQRVSMCLTVPAGTRGEGEVGTMTLDGGQTARARFVLRGSEQYAAAWNWLYGTWLPDSGYEPDDRPCYEQYLSNPDEDPEGRHIVEIGVPVRPAR